MRAMDQRGGALPESANLLTALTQTTYTFQGDELLLEPKADLKARIGFSPDEFDALILTFARPVTVPESRPRFRQLQWSTIFFAKRTGVMFLPPYDYDPFGERLVRRTLRSKVPDC